VHRHTNRDAVSGPLHLMVVVPITEDAAYTLDTEHGQGIDWRVANFYRREADGWKIVHHHTEFSWEVAQAPGK
jgi:SnoaL-like domain